ncbi:MAG: hypothetical protein WAN75_04605 [Xanthobacteraceae bacterium]|jgi:hypothetical protein
MRRLNEPPALTHEAAHEMIPALLNAIRWISLSAVSEYLLRAGGSAINPWRGPYCQARKVKKFI